jgi:hypothetical protein
MSIPMQISPKATVCFCHYSSRLQFRFRLVHDEFIFRKHCVSFAAAEEDTQFLSECFVDTGDVRHLLDCESPNRIIVGRTGSGKSALIFRLPNSHPHVYPLAARSFPRRIAGETRKFPLLTGTETRLGLSRAVLRRCGAQQGRVRFSEN